MRLFLHIGTEKTGSTTIQKVLEKNSDYLLKKQGYLYPRTQSTNSHRNFVAFGYHDKRDDEYTRKHCVKGSADKANWRREFIQDWESQLEELGKYGQNVIISSELFHSRYNLDDISCIFSFLTQYFNEIQVIVYLRRQDIVAVSRYSTALRVGMRNFSMFPPDAVNNRYFNYELLLEMWSAVFGEENIVVHTFEKYRFPGCDLVKDFFGMVDLELEEWKTVKPQNKSLSFGNQIALDKLNTLYRRKGVGISDRNPKLDALVRKLIVGGIGESYKPLRSDAYEFFCQFEQINRHVSESYQNCSSLFSDVDFSVYPNEYSDQSTSCKNVIETLVEELVNTLQ